MTSYSPKKQSPRTRHKLTNLQYWILRALKNGATISVPDPPRGNYRIRPARSVAYVEIPRRIGMSFLAEHGYIVENRSTTVITITPKGKRKARERPPEDVTLAMVNPYVPEDYRV